LSVFQDIFSTVFAVSGVSSVIGAFNQQQVAAARLQAAYTRLSNAQSTGTIAQVNNAQKALNALINQTQNAGVSGAVTAASVQAAGAIRFIHAEIDAVREAVDAYEDYGRQIRTIQGITGSSARQAEQFENLAHIGGINNIQSVLEVIRLNNDFRTPRGKAAFQTIGITPDADPNSLETFNKVIAKLQGMQDGIKKTGLELDLFGVRGVRALQPFLNIYPDIADKARALDSNLEGGALQAVTHLQQNTELLGRTFLVDFIIPIVQKIIPALDLLVTGVEGVIGAFHKLDAATGGLASWVIIIAGIGAGVVAMTVAFANAVKVIELVRAAIIATSAAQAVLDALSGPAGWAALAVAGIVTVGAGAAYYSSQNNSATDAANTTNTAAQTMQNAANTMQDAVNTLRTWSSAAGDQIGQYLTPQQYAFIVEQRAQGAVG
jgi:hypothetical protein